MTKLVQIRQNQADRIETQDDEKKRAIDLFELRLVPPEDDIFAEPTRCYKLNKQWAKIVMGMVRHLTDIAAWKDATDETYIGCTQVAKFMAQADDCDDLCTIEILLSDPDFFQNEYVPMTFGDWVTNTNDFNADLNTDYDGTPQSIGEDIPTTVPNDIEKNALCYALMSFVGLYASSKLCILQSRNFVQIAWDEVRTAVGKVFNGIVNSLGFIYTPNLYSCVVDVSTAMLVLQDETAIDELGCFLYNELEGVVIDEDDFNDALLAAATTLTDNAQKLACLMLNDNNLTVYLNFLEAYNIALQRIANGETLECSCITGSYRLWTYDFSNGFGLWNVVYSGQIPMGEIVGSRIKGRDIGDVSAITLTWDDFDPSWRVRGVKVYYERKDGLSNGVDDIISVILRPTPNSNVGSSSIISQGGQPNGVLVGCGTRHAVPPGYVTAGLQLRVSVTVSDTATDEIWLDRIEILFMDGFAHGGVPTDDGDLCT